MSLVVIFAALALVSLPAALHRFGLRLPPAEWAYASAGALVVGVLLVHAALATTVGLRLLLLVDGPLSAGLEGLAHHLSPGGVVGGVAAALAGTTQAVAVIGALRRTRRLRRRAAVESWIGDRRRVGNVDIVVVPGEEPVAHCNPSGAGQVVVSESLMRYLDPAEVAAVVRHEAAHLRHRHHRYLWVAELAERAVPRLSGPSVNLLRQSIEQWADEDAAATRGGRDPLRSALLQLRARKHSANGGVDERVALLSRPAQPPRLSARMAALVPSAGLAGIGLVTLGDWSDHVHLVLAASGFWPIPH